MVSAVWFFSALSQAMAAIVAFIITISTVIYQLEQSSRRDRTDELRNKLRELNKSYQPALYSVMELLKQPYDSQLPNNYPEESKLTVNKIEQIYQNISTDDKARDLVWIYCNYINHILNKIPEDTESSEIYLLTSDELSELELALGKLDSLIINGDPTLQSSIEKACRGNNVSVRTEIFDQTSSEYADLDSWFDQHFDPHREVRSLEGTDLLSMSNFFSEFHNDVKKVLAESEYTILNHNDKMKQLFRPVILLLVVGVIVPLGSIIGLQMEEAYVEIDIMNYQVALLSTTIILLIYIIHILWREFS